jgi:hypothetical protein
MHVKEGRRRKSDYFKWWGRQICWLDSSEILTGQLGHFSSKFYSILSLESNVDSGVSKVRPTPYKFDSSVTLVETVKPS